MWWKIAPICNTFRCQGSQFGTPIDEYVISNDMKRRICPQRNRSVEFSAGTTEGKSYEILTFHYINPTSSKWTSFFD